MHTAESIAYAEALVPDPGPAIAILTGLGFAPAGALDQPGRLSYRMRRGAAEFRLSVPQPGTGEEDRLALRGPGITRLGLWVSNVHGVCGQAEDAGATIVMPHSQDRAEILTPDGIGYVLMQRPAPAAPRAVIRFDHAALAVRPGAMMKTVAFYESFGLAYMPEEDLVIGKGDSAQGLISGVLYSRGGGLAITLVAQDPLHQPGQISGFIHANSGPGVQHMAVHVPSTITEVREAARRGVRWKDAPLPFYERLILEGIAPPDLDALRETRCVYDQDSNGGLYQKFTEPFLGPSWAEFITRVGSAGFGKGAITALYESAMG